MHRRSPKLPFALVAFCALSVVTASCAREEGPPRDARAESVATAVQRLQGRWLLQAFQPAGHLDFALQTMLNAQIGQLVLDVNGTNMSIRGPGVVVQRTFRVDEAYAERLQMTVFDSYGVGFRMFGNFNGNNAVVIDGNEAPWVGRATLVRIP
jgi:hypothetical protein